ncbi:UdgX family uracil-DNA binding protein [Rhizobium tumorigenes]|uniref:Type-4 uracil-DNA glycosylase n=1 Tax=Rhizobium tumorigenes TaxID=2041385 RepID=A0AAF1K2C1_9HYPH|nr:UdgX family uracil-DNA binding protein [Rhizobium tumorigenes]WFR94156.1 UdgX family uracil-DNA binding protein [Rhizobium tumorigenes]
MGGAVVHRVTLKGRGDLAEWRDAARPLLGEGVLPEAIDWREAALGGDLFAGSGDSLLLEPTEPLPRNGSGVGPEGTPPVTVPPAFIGLAEAVLCHSDPGRFALLYRILFRLGRDRRLLDIVSDVDVHRALMLQKAVRRDCHKMTAFVRFKEVDSEMALPRRRFVAWFEPDHHIVARKAPFFQRRFNDMDWLIATPRGSATWDGTQLSISDLPVEKPSLTDEADTLWRTYFSNIFNPARLKVKAMQAEMPKKYWKNLPEADLIPGLIAGAEASVLAMAKRAATEPLPFHQRLQAAAAAGRPVVATAPEGSIEALREAASHCTRCELHCHATQTVFGEGPADASVMVVGEQPGDHEDLAGRPFVGPAGRVFNQAIDDAGIDGTTLYVTNAVKHFKYEPRGKRRIHQKPTMGEVRHCRWWLDGERALIRPKLTVALGATALFALTDSRQKLEDVRGQPLPLADGSSLFVTVHPSYLLRIPDAGRKAEELARFQAEMRSISRLVGQADAAS